MTIEPGTPLRPLRGPTREYRAAVAFLISGVFVLVVLLLVQGAVPDAQPPVSGVIFAAGVFLAMVAMLAMAFGLAASAPWAIAVVTPMLAILIVSGAISSVVALTRSTIELPIGLVLGVWALRAPLRAPLAIGRAPGGWGPAGWLVVVAMVVGNVLPNAGGILLFPGGPLIAGADALERTLTVECDSKYVTPPTSARITYSWSWTRAEPWVAGLDSVTIDAYIVGTIEDGLTIESAQSTSVGVYQADISIGDRPLVVFGVDIGQNVFGAGEVEVVLLPPRSLPPGSGSIEVQARYQHGPASAQPNNFEHIWEVEAHASCEW